jgi:hypothetical protein
MSGGEQGGQETRKKGGGGGSDLKQASRAYHRIFFPGLGGGLPGYQTNGQPRPSSSSALQRLSADPQIRPACEQSKKHGHGPLASGTSHSVSHTVSLRHPSPPSIPKDLSPCPPVQSVLVPIRRERRRTVPGRPSPFIIFLLSAIKQPPLPPPLRPPGRLPSFYFPSPFFLRRFFTRGLWESVSAWLVPHFLSLGAS